MFGTAPQNLTLISNLNPISAHSTAITHAGYESHSQMLAIIFSGSPNCVYLYQNVTSEIADHFERAKSKGSWFDQELRPYLNLYPFMKVAVIGETV